jgi:O-antigen ligase
VLLLAFVASLQISIAAADILLTAVLLSWVVLLIHERARPSAPPFFLALAAYAGMTLISSFFSLDPSTSLRDDKQLVLFLIVPAVYDLARGQRASTVVDVIVTVGAASAAFGIIQYGMLHYNDRGLRPEGALTHYMTYSGVLMLVLCAAVARLVFGSRGRVWPALVLPALVVALSLTLTRSAWVGAGVAVGLLLALKDFRLTALVPLTIALVFAFGPSPVTSRVLSVFDLRDPTNRDRLAMVRAGSSMIGDRPLTGVGPNMVPRVYPQYREPDAVEFVQPHLHNVPVQIAAERGLPALVVFLWFVGWLGVSLFRIFRGGQDRILSSTAVAAVAAMLAAGLFEYNFGDSEFLMLFLVLVTLPFAATRTDAAASGLV